MAETKQQRQPASDHGDPARPPEGSGVTREELESLVAERTRELNQANLSLKAQIAEREGIEAALLKQTKIFSSILDNMSDAVIVADRDEQFLIFNPAATRMFGGGPESTAAGDWAQRYGLLLPDASTFPTDATTHAPFVASERRRMLVKHDGAPNGLWPVSADDTGR